MKKSTLKFYQRFHIETKKTSPLIPHPHRFNVKVNRLALAKLLFKEIIHYKGNLAVVKSRPCVYGVFSGPIGGFAPKESLCVGCLRCTTEHPDVVSIFHNPLRKELGDSYFKSEDVDTVTYESESGHIPIKGAGYRGKFDGPGWDEMWTDMSEIVRPTRDGIHGREYISTAIDLGEKPPFINFSLKDADFFQQSKTLSLPNPLLFDTLPDCLLSNQMACSIFIKAAKELETLAIFPLKTLIDLSLRANHLIPLLSYSEMGLLANLGYEPACIEMEGWDLSFYQALKKDNPNALLILRAAFEIKDLLEAFQAGVRIFHLTANYHGRGQDDKFIKDIIRETHLAFVKAGVREEITLIGSGGIILAEHVPKAILCGLDGVALDTSLLVALQARFKGNSLDRRTCHFQLPNDLFLEWGSQRLKNLIASWRDQLLEILGAMGLKEVRRLRGEIGRALFSKDLEKEAFTGIKGL